MIEYLNKLYSGEETDLSLLSTIDIDVFANWVVPYIRNIDPNVLNIIKEVCRINNDAPTHIQYISGDFRIIPTYLRSILFLRSLKKEEKMPIVCDDFIKIRWKSDKIYDIFANYVANNILSFIHTIEHYDGENAICLNRVLVESLKYIEDDIPESVKLKLEKRVIENL